MTQEVLAEALHECGAYADRDSDPTRNRTARSVIESLAARGYALVRTPETLDDSTLLERLATALYDVRWWEKASYDGLSTGELARDLYNLLAAAPSPTPPEGLREARTALTDLIEATWGGYVRPADDAGILNAVADWMDRLDDVADGILTESTSDIRVSRAMQDDLRRIALASPAPDPEGLHDEFAWLIERGQPEKQVPTVWWADRKRWGLAHMDEWTEDANKAYRFASKAEAEDYIERHSPIPSHRPRLGRAVEHGFLASPAPDPGAGLREALVRIEQLTRPYPLAETGWPQRYPPIAATEEAHAVAVAALAPSAEPPETETT